MTAWFEEEDKKKMKEYHSRKNHNGIMVYIAGPIHGSGTVGGNLRLALHVAEMLNDSGFTPFVPNLFIQWDAAYETAEDQKEEKWMGMDLEWLSRCDILVRLPGKSPGADREVAFARDLGIPVYENDEVPGIKPFSQTARLIAEFRAGKLSHLALRNPKQVRGALLRSEFGVTVPVACAAKEDASERRVPRGIPEETIRGVLDNRSEFWDLSTIQQNVYGWLKRQPFGKQEKWQPLLGLVEELGELSHGFLKKSQNIRGSAADHDAAMEDAVGDILIYLAGFCTANDISLGRAFERAWDEVSSRDWNRFPKNGKTE